MQYQIILHMTENKEKSYDISSGNKQQQHQHRWQWQKWSTNRRNNMLHGVKEMEIEQRADK